jgi:hypothetical protein
MDVDTIDREYQQLEQEAQAVTQAFTDVAAKMQTAAASNPDVRDWLLDLKSIMLQVQTEQLQVQQLLQAMHDFTVNTLQAPAQPTYQAPAAPVAQAVAPQPAPSGGLLSRFTSGGFGRSIAQGAGMGAGFAIGDDIINSLFS